MTTPRPHEMLLEPLSKAGRLAIMQALARLKQPLNEALQVPFLNDMFGKLGEQALPAGCLPLLLDEVPKRIYFVLSGKWVLFARSKKRKGKLRIHCILESPFFFLPAQLLTGQGSSLELLCITGCRVVSIGKADYLALIAAYGDAFLLTHLWQQQQEELVLGQQELLNTGTTYEKMCWLDDHWPQAIGFPASLLAQYLNCSRERVSRTRLRVLKRKR